VRVLLDENLPRDLASGLSPHVVATVAGLGWAGITNGELLRRAATHFEAFVTMDQNLEFQQPTARQPFGVIVISAASNRMQHLTPLIPAIFAALDGIAPGELRRVGA
jgi:hypothetical protein